MPLGYGIPQRLYANIPVGVRIRGTIAKLRTFRVCPGNGFFGTKIGRTYQHNYAYAPNDPTADHCGDANKLKMRQAMAAWRALSDDEKNAWREKAAKRNLPMHGSNLFVRRYILGLL